MYNVFNASRFRKLFIKHTSENYKNYFISVVVLFGMLAVVYWLFVIGAKDKTMGMRYMALIAVYILAGCIFTSSVFGNFTGKRKAIPSLTLPASHFEKFMVGWVYSFVIFTVVYLLIYTIADYMFMALSASKDKRSLITLIKEEPIPLGMFLYYAFLHSIMIYGALKFRSLHFIKTAAIIFIGIVVLFITHSWFLEWLIAKEIGFSLPFMNDLSIITNGTTAFYRVTLDVYERFIYTGLMSIGFAIAMWTAAYYRLQEKEI